MSVVLFGPPGAGKGTQAEKIATQSGKFHVSTGNLFRDSLKEETPLGLEIRSYVEAGCLVPDTVTIALVRQVLSEEQCRDFVFDGFPRTCNQAQALNELIDELKAVSIKCALFLEVSREVLMKRLTGRRICRDCGMVYHVENFPSSKEGVCDRCGGSTYQRKDDGSDVISTRLESYAKNTEPLKEFYKKRGLFVSVEGLGDPDLVFKRLEGYL